MTEEKWYHVPFNTRYIASNHGRIIGPKGRFLNPTETIRGYLVCSLDGVQYRVNRIICTTFHGYPPTEDHQAAHKDNNKANNHAGNLYWATPEENGADLAATNKKKGENSAINILTEQDVAEIKRLHREGARVIGISRKYPQVSYMAISQIVHGRAWKHVK